MVWDSSSVCKVLNVGLVEIVDKIGNKSTWFMSIEYHPYAYFKLEVNYYAMDKTGDITDRRNDSSISLESTFITIENGKIKMLFNDEVLLFTSSQVDNIKYFFELMAEYDSNCKR